MVADKQMGFLKEKILETRTALFMSLADSILKMPVCIVNTICVDEVGQIWFLVSRPQQSINEFDKQFPVELNYYRKGNSFTLKVYGKAYIMDDPEEMLSTPDVISQLGDTNYGDMVVIKVKIARADYFERKEGEAFRFWSKVKENFNQFFFNHTHPQPQIHQLSFHPEAAF